MSSERIVVVGAGIIGCSAAFHLLQQGARDVTVVDALEPGAATTGAGAGFVSHWSAGMYPLGEEGLGLQQYGLDFYRWLNQLGSEIGYRANGTLMMALTEAGRERFVRPVLESPFAPPEMQDLSAAQIGERASGLVDPAKVHSGAFNPHGIQVDTRLATNVLARQLVDLGGKLRLGTRVEGIEDTGAGVRVATDRGVIEADGVVLAAGAWINELLEGLGWRVPLLRIVATRILTDDRGLPSTLPTVQCRELRLWLRETFGAVMWGTGRHYRPLYRSGEGDALALGQPRNAELMKEMLEQELSGLQEIFPPLRGSRVQAWAQGVPCYTPDTGLIVGRVPGSANIVAIGGDNETGVSHGPGLGRLAAELLLGRKPFVEASRFRLERFTPGAYRTEADVEAAMPVRAFDPSWNRLS